MGLRRYTTMKPLLIETPASDGPRIYLGTGMHAASPHVLLSLDITSVAYFKIELVNYWGSRATCDAVLSEARHLNARLILGVGNGDDGDAVSQRVSSIRTWVDTKAAGIFDRRIEYLTIPSRDSDDEDASAHFHACHRFIQQHSVHAAHCRVLAHCHAGISRSCTILCTHLMPEYGMSRDEALATISTCGATTSSVLPT